MRVTERQRRALEAICDTFAPAHDGLPAASEVGVPDAFLFALEHFAEPRDRTQLLAVLSVWDAIARGFARRPLAEREGVLRAWRDSRLEQRRTVYKALRKGTLFHYFGLPGGPRDALAYPGPRSGGSPESPLQVTRPESDVELSCDVCVVGSGAGGGAAAAVLAAAGLDVIVLEAGGAATAHRDEIEALRALYLDGAVAATDDQSIDLIAGACVGGGTWVNWTTSLRTPDDVRAEWAGHGVPAFAAAEFDRSLDWAWEQLDVNDEHGTPSARDRALERGLTSLDWHVGAQGRNTRGCDQGAVCGYCGFGCALGAKRTSVEAWFATARARVLIGTRVDRVIVERGAAVGIEASAATAHVRVRARAVVVACGALHTPALLRRSGLANLNIGRHLRLHPVTLVFGEFEDEIRPWEGSLQARYSEQHARLDGGYGVRYETPPLHPGFFGGAVQWDGGHATLEFARRFAHLAPVFPLLRDRDSGEVVVTRDGRPRARYRLSRYDLRHLRLGFAGAARILEAAGARRLVSTHVRPVVWECARGGVGRFLAEADIVGWEPNRVLYASAHLLGTARMGGSPAASACDPQGEAWEVSNLVVCDGSTFPTASGVNPMISIAAVAHLNASALAAKLT